MSDDPKFDELLRREAKGYRATTPPPADAMWSRIEGDVANAIQRPERRLGRYWPWMASAAGIAAALVIGVAIGRRSAPPAPAPMTVASDRATISADSLRELQRRAAALQHFAEAEVFLTEVRADLKTGRQDPEREERSRALLARTRLLLANDGSGAPPVERLLQDLELVLAEIAALPDSGGRGSVDAKLLENRLRVGTILPRIRTILPQSPFVGGS